MELEGLRLIHWSVSMEMVAQKVLERDLLCLPYPDFHESLDMKLNLNVGFVFLDMLIQHKLK